jgi:hypothetical protein
MIFQLLFAIILLIIIVFIGLRILGNIIVGVSMIALVMLASFIIAGSLPDLQAIPIIGKYVPSLPSAAEAIAFIKNQVYSVDVLGTSRDSSNNLIIIVGNTGRLDVSSLNVSVNNQPVQILNLVDYPIKSKQVVALQTNWKSDYTNITVSSNNAQATYP